MFWLHVLAVRSNPPPGKHWALTRAVEADEDAQVNRRPGGPSRAAVRTAPVLLLLQQCTQHRLVPRMLLRAHAKLLVLHPDACLVLQPRQVMVQRFRWQGALTEHVEQRSPRRRIDPKTHLRLLAVPQARLMVSATGQ